MRSGTGLIENYNFLNFDLSVSMSLEKWTFLSIYSLQNLYTSKMEIFIFPEFYKIFSQLHPIIYRESWNLYSTELC